jgi:alpha-L-fucosidase
MKTHSLITKLFLPVIILLTGSNLCTAQSKIEPMATGKYDATWQSLKQYSSAPEWYRDAKFGIWAHWGPQCQPEQGDWYARFMYFTGTTQFNWHAANYGNQKTFGFKDVINTWKAESWDPDSLVRLYKRVGAQYFMAMANHHDNLDMYDSKYQPWNTVNVGPKKDIIAGWAAAAKKMGLPFGVSVHAAHAWTWLEPSQDFDGKLTKADGAGKWWEGLDPQDLYAQNHARSTGSTNSGTIHSQWNWGIGASQPDTAYLNKFYNRTVDLLNKYTPDLIYFDDTALPFFQISDVGLKIAAHMYNKNPNAVIFGKVLTDDQKECMVWDVERGIPDRAQAKPWQTCTCIGDWHYNRSVYNNNGYKSASTVIRMLIDIVSKNGNLLLNIPVRGNGTIDEKELAVLNGIAPWMAINNESIYGTRPWASFGEGPTADAVKPLSAQGFNEGTSYSSLDIRYAKKDSFLYATAMGWPTSGIVNLKNIALSSPYYPGKVKSIRLLGSGILAYTQSINNVAITLPATKTSDIALVLKMTFDSNYSITDLEGLIKQCTSIDSIAKLNMGTNSGQYRQDAVSALEAQLTMAKSITASNSVTEIATAFTSLQSVYASFCTNGKLEGGLLEYSKTQNITAKYLKDVRNFSRTDVGVPGTGRFGLLAEPWVYTNNIVNQDNFTTGGFDNYSSGKSIGIQKWNSTDPAITNGKIYQTTTLPAGSYKLRIKVHENYGLVAGEDYLSVTVGNTLPETSKVPSAALVYYDMSQSTTGQQVSCCSFTLTQPTEVSIGWSTTIAAAAVSKSMRVNEILLLDNNNIDLSATYLRNYTNIARKDISYTRFGAPTNWTVDNFNIPQTNQDGTKHGIDKNPGYNTLMMGVWNDLGQSTKDASNAKIYQKVKLPAGKYFFGANYNTLYSLSKTYIFASKVIPDVSNVETSAIAYHNIGTDMADGSMYGIEFNLTEETDLYIGWIGNYSTPSTQEFRVKEVSLLQILSNNDNYIEANAISSGANKNINISMKQFARVTNAEYALTRENNGYLIGTTKGIVELGVVDFNTNKYDKIFLYTAITDAVANGASYDFYLDNQTTAFASVPAIVTPGKFDFTKSESTIGQISGIHKVTLKYNNHTSSLLSIGFTDTNATSVKEIRLTDLYKVYSIKNTIVIDGLNFKDVSVFEIDGSLLAKKTSVSGKAEFNVNKGVYLVSIGGKGAKVIVE